METLCHVKHIVRLGGAEYAKLGRPNNTGTRILCVSGDVQKPGYFEVEVGSLTMGELINEVCGGPKTGRTVKAVIPGGSSAKVLSASERFKLKEKQADGAMARAGDRAERHRHGFRFARGRGLHGRLRRRDRAGRLARHGLGAE